MAHELKMETYGDSVMTKGDYALDGAKANEYLALAKPPVFPNPNPALSFGINWSTLSTCK